MKTRTALGKRVLGNLYFHVTTLERFVPHVREQVQQVVRQATLETEAEFNVIKFDEETQKISLLFYENFFDNPFPTLQRSCVVDVVSGRVKQLYYNVSKNPPVLHRKELLLPSDHPGVSRFAALT